MIDNTQALTPFLSLEWLHELKKAEIPGFEYLNIESYTFEQLLRELPSAITKDPNDLVAFTFSCWYSKTDLFGNGETLGFILEYAPTPATIAIDSGLEPFFICDPDGKVAIAKMFLKLKSEGWKEHIPNIKP